MAQLEQPLRATVRADCVDRAHSLLDEAEDMVARRGFMTW